VTARAARLTRSHPISLNSDPTLGNRESRWCLQTLDFPILQLGAFAILFFCPQHFSPCRNLPSLMPAAWPRWLLPGRLFLSFNPGFSPPRHLLTYHSILECFPRGTGCCALICHCEAWFAVLSLLHMHPADSLHFRFCYRPCCDTSW
jgi:hypothetical protein